MNKKLEEYKVTKGDKYREFWEEGGARPEIHQGFEDGFDAAIALDLPVKFTEWLSNDSGYVLDKEFSRTRYKRKKGGGYQTQEQLFQYYIDNVHKFE